MDTYQETLKTWHKPASLYQDRFMDLDLYNETYDFVCQTDIHTILTARKKHTQ